MIMMSRLLCSILLEVLEDANCKRSSFTRLRHFHCQLCRVNNVVSTWFIYCGLNTLVCTCCRFWHLPGSLTSADIHSQVLHADRGWHKKPRWKRGLRSIRPMVDPPRVDPPHLPATFLVDPPRRIWGAEGPGKWGESTTDVYAAVPPHSNEST